MRTLFLGICCLFFIAISSATVRAEERKTTIFSSPDLMRCAVLCSELASAPDNREKLLELAKALQQIKEPGNRAPFMVVYSMGGIVVGNARSAGSAKAWLLKNTPDHPMVQLLSLENLGKICPVCLGDGKQERPCSRCQGSGKCSLCGGTGTSSVAGSNSTCNVCNGTGKCQGCAGNGVVEFDCRRCHGRKRVLSDERVREVYTGLLEQYRKAVDFYQNGLASAENPDRLAELKSRIRVEITGASKRDTPDARYYANTLRELLDMCKTGLFPEFLLANDESTPKAESPATPANTPASAAPRPPPPAEEQPPVTPAPTPETQTPPNPGKPPATPPPPDNKPDSGKKLDFFS